MTTTNLSPQTMDELRADLGIGTRPIRPVRWCWCNRTDEPAPHGHRHPSWTDGCPEQRVAWKVRRSDTPGLWSVFNPGSAEVMACISWQTAQDWTVDRARTGFWNVYGPAETDLPPDEHLAVCVDQH